MPYEFTVFSASNRQPNVVYNSDTVVVPNDRMCKLTLTNLDLVNEPSTTVVYWEIQRSPGEGQPFYHMVSTTFRGCDGIQPPKPIGTLSCSIDGIVGQLVRGTMYFTSAGDTRKRFGVSGKTY